MLCYNCLCPLRTGRCGPVVLGPGGGERELLSGRVRGPDPLAPFGPGAAAAVLRADAFPHTADLMVNSAVDPDRGTVHAFEAQAGSHGGLGGPQSRPFLLHPVELPAGEEPLLGGQALHEVFRGWLAADRAPEHPPAPRPPLPETAPTVSRSL